MWIDAAERGEFNMAGDPIKFRCFQCQKLLGVSRSKAGAVVSCPKCGAGLLVPELSPEAAPSQPLDLSSSGAAQSDGTPELVFADLRLDPTLVANSSGPVDLSGVNSSPAFLAQPIDPESDVVFPQIQTVETSLRPEPWRRTTPTLQREAEPNSAPAPAPVPAPSPALSPPPLFNESNRSPITVAAIPVMVPAPSAVRNESTDAEPEATVSQSLTPVEERLSTRRRDDVVLPRVVVLLWSFFVVLALGFAFGAGLLWGYYLWVGRIATRS
jgi:DNA-directed RNA polymerase subunit RPC12/RpoP